MAKQTTLSGGFLAPSAKRKPTDSSFKESWKEVAPWPNLHVSIHGVWIHVD